LTPPTPTKIERLRTLLEKPYVKIPLIFGLLLYAGFVTVYLFIAIASLYVLGSLVGIPTLQLVTSSVSAVSAAASAAAALLVWRGNVQTRNRVLIDRVLGPIYSEIRRTRELLESWRAKSNDSAVGIPFLKQVRSEWLYYTLDESLRGQLDEFQELVAELSQQRDICKKTAGEILTKTASTQFNLENVSTIYLWRSHDWTEGSAHGENGRMPTWELVVESQPLWAASGYYVHLFQVVDFNSAIQFSLPLLNPAKERINVVEFEKYWNEAMKLASQDKSIQGFRQMMTQAVRECSKLEKKIDSEIKHLR
jgi:hypothetical protein